MLWKYLPSADAVRNSAALRWMGPILNRPCLWKANRHSIASGAAVGLFFGVATPIAQIPLAALAAILLRANLPVAVLFTLVSNPLTFVPILVLAYTVGASVPGVNPDAPLGSAPDAAWTNYSFDEWVQNAGEMAFPLIVGMLILASVGAIIAYVAVDLSWRINGYIARRRRRRALAASACCRCSDAPAAPIG